MDIYRERKLLGEKLVPSILKAVNYDIEHTVFSFIPNTAEVAFYGMLQGLDEYLNEEKVKQIAALGDSRPGPQSQPRRTGAYSLSPHPQ